MKAFSRGTAARLVLVGVRGFGEVHAERIARLAERGQVELVAAVDPAVAGSQSTIYGVDLYADLAEALAVVRPVDVVVVAAPIGAHYALARTALAAGADVYLEKPPVTSLAELAALLDLERETGRVVQVGFQSLGSEALTLPGHGCVRHRHPSPVSGRWAPGHAPSATGAAPPGRDGGACTGRPSSTGW